MKILPVLRKRGYFSREKKAKVEFPEVWELVWQKKIKLHEVRDPFILLWLLRNRAQTFAPGKFIILSENAKILKNTKVGFFTGCIHLSPEKESVPFGGRNMCPGASAGCSGCCLKESGCHNLPYAKVKRIALTLWWIYHPEEFKRRLAAEVRAFIEKVRRKSAREGVELTPAIRPNALSDDRPLALWLVRTFPEVLFYDYSKLGSTWKYQADNYFLTFSRSETNWAECLEALRHGVNVAVVFDGDSLPEFYEGYRVIDGDESDARFLERYPEPVIIGLRLKGINRAKLHAISTGFAV